MKQECAQTILKDAKKILEFVIEGNQSLLKEIAAMSREMNERFDLVDARLEALNQKIDSVAADLGGKIDNVAADISAHRADTESHPKGYKVSE